MTTLLLSGSGRGGNAIGALLRTLKAMENIR
jgi:hypothetical protein